MIPTAVFFLSLAFQQSTPIEAQPLARRGALGLSFSPVASDQATKLGLEPGVGVTVVQRVPGFTGEKLNLQAGDIITQFNGTKPKLSTIGVLAARLRSGEKLSVEYVRAGKKLTSTATVVEKPRDPGTSDYTVEYSQVVSNGKRMRTIITHPKKAGKFPVLYFIQGFSPISYDFTLSTSTGEIGSLDGPILYEFAKNNFVVVRVEKPDVGDSEGGPFADIDYTTELDIYRQTLKQIKGLSDADPDKVFIFGHSMGAAFGPMIAAESKVAGICIYGGAARTWQEYILDTVRYQGLLGGETFEQADDSVRVSSRIISLAFHEGKSAEQIKADHPELSQAVDGLFPGGMFNQKTLEFWRQLGQINFPSYWVKANTKVLSVHGATDFVTYDADHKLIADAVNQVRPGWGKFVICPNSDHLFHNFPTEEAALKGYSKGKFNPAFTKIMMDWIQEILAQTDKK